MFSKLNLLFLVLPSIQALTINTPVGLTSGGTATITWTNDAGDPDTWSLELVNTVFHNSFAIANNVQPESGSITLGLPIVPAGDGYTLEAVAISNIDQIFATSGSFSIGEVATGSTTLASTTTASSSSSSSSKSGTTTALTTTTTATTSGFGTTATNTRPATTSSSSSSSTSSSPATTTSNAAVPMKFAFAASNVGAIAAVLMSVVGGAAVFAL